MQILNEYSHETHLTPSQMDWAWSHGLRHFGIYFFRYNISPTANGFLHIMPLRVRLASFIPSKSQRRILKRNADVDVRISETQLDAKKHQLFESHKKRFAENVPDSLNIFLDVDAAHTPCPNREICLYLQGELIGVSFLDIGGTATSSVYSMFEPRFSKRSLGILLILKSIQYSKQLGKTFYYPGYAHREPSYYDYKKNFRGLEYYNWNQSWLPFIEQTV